MSYARAVASQLLLLLLFSATGCLIESNIAADGSATLRVKYRLSGEDLKQARLRMQSKAVEIVSAEIDEEKWATFVLEMKDITQLSTVPFFQQTQVSRTAGEAGTEVLQAKISRQKPLDLPDKTVEYLGKEIAITVTLPGEIVKSNASNTKENTATWKMPMKEFFKTKGDKVLEAEYKKLANEN